MHEDLAPVLRIKAAVEMTIASLLPSTFAPFNSVLVNRYDDGNAGIKWHADDEKCYGNAADILIASVSIGASRPFELRTKPRKGVRTLLHRIVLQSASLLVMGGATQRNWQVFLCAGAQARAHMVLGLASIASR